MIKGKMEAKDFSLDPTEVVSPIEVAEALLAGLTSKETAEALLKMAGPNYYQKTYEVSTLAGLHLSVRWFSDGAKAELVGYKTSRALRGDSSLTVVDLLDHLRIKGELYDPTKVVVLHSSSGEEYGKPGARYKDFLIEFGYRIGSAEELVESVGDDFDAVIEQILAWRSEMLSVNEKRKRVLP